MTPQQIVDLIQVYIDCATRNDDKACRDYLTADSDAEREIAHNLVQMATAQKVVLQNILDEIAGVSV